jgi:intein/homing endonuclease
MAAHKVKESLRYLNNAKEILKSIPVEDNTYTDLKHVREAFAIAYLAVLEAINEYLIKKGFTKKELPKSVDAYRKALQKYIAVHNGKLMREFEKLYDALDIAGYYRGLIYDVEAVNVYLKAAKSFIEKIG